MCKGAGQPTENTHQTNVHARNRRLCLQPRRYFHRSRLVSSRMKRTKSSSAKGKVSRFMEDARACASTVWRHANEAVRGQSLASSFLAAFSCPLLVNLHLYFRDSKRSQHTNQKKHFFGIARSNKKYLPFVLLLMYSRILFYVIPSRLR